MSGTITAPWGGGMTVRAIGSSKGHSSMFTITQTATLASPGSFSGLRSTMGLKSTRGLVMDASFLLYPLPFIPSRQGRGKFTFYESVIANGAGRTPLSRRRLLDGEPEDLQHLVYEMEGYLLFDLRRHVLEILFIPPGQDDRLHPGAVGGEDLVLDSAHREDQTPEGDLARHGEVLLHRPVREERSQGGEHRDPRRRAVLGNGAGGDMDMEVHLFEEVPGDPQFVGVRADETQRRGGRFLHHVAELAGQGEPLFPRHGRRLDEQEVPAGRRPGEPHDYSWLCGPGRRLGGDPDRSEETVQVPRLYSGFFDDPLGDLGRHAAADRGQLPFEVPDASFPGIAGDDATDRAFREADLFGLAAVRLGLPRDQIALGDPDLLIDRISGQFDPLQAVAERRRESLHDVRRCDENHVGQVEGDVQIVIDD